MKNPNHKRLRAANWLLAGILALLGFSGCNDDDGSGLVAMYGSQKAAFLT